MQTCLRCLQLHSCSSFISTARPSFIAGGLAMRRVRRLQSLAWLYEVPWSLDGRFNVSRYTLQVGRRLRGDAPVIHPSRPPLTLSDVQTSNGLDNSPDPPTHSSQQMMNRLPSSPIAGLPELSELPRPITDSLPATASRGSNLEEFNGLWGIEEVLFGLSDRHTGAVTCLLPQDRVAAPRMPLFPEWAKRVFFEESQWLERFDRLWERGRCEERTTAEAASGDSAPGGVSHAVDSPSEGDNPPSAKLVSTPPLLSSPSKVNMNNQKDSSEVWDGGTFVSSISNPSFPPLYADVLGRPKIVRCLLYNFLANPTYWRDAVDELLQLAEEKVWSLGIGSTDGHTDFKASQWSLEHLLRPMESVVFYSPGLREVLWRVLDMSPASFIGPVAMWFAFVVAHRQDAALLRSPHQPPFSFSEVNPTLTPHDFDYCRFASGKTNLAVAYEGCERETTPCGSPRGGPLDVLTEEEWKGMSETQQIELLFGKDAVSELATATTAVLKGNSSECGDIFVFNPSSTRSRLSGDSDNDSDSDNTSDLLDQLPSPESGVDFTHIDPEKEAMLEQMRHEMQRLYAYELDHFLLGIVECTYDSMMKTPCVDLPPSLQTFSEEKRKQTGMPRPRKDNVLRDSYYANGLFRNARSGEIEDVHLAQLWKAFQDEDTGMLLDHWVHVRRRLHVVQRELRAELAIQAAFKLLFFSRDEVRAVTNPKDSYHRLWRLHQELVELLTPAGTKVAHKLVSSPVKSPLPDATPVAHSMEYLRVQFPSFESLPLDQKVSYTCFGRDHLLNVKDNDTSHNAIQCSKDIIEKVEPFALFCGYCQAMHPAHETFLHSNDGALQRISIRYLTLGQIQIAYQSLTPLQKSAILYCFPGLLENEDTGEKLPYAPRISNAEVNLSKGKEISREEACAPKRNEIEPITSVECNEGISCEVELSESCGSRKKSEMHAEQLNVQHDFLESIPSSKVKDVQKGIEGPAYSPKASFLKEGSIKMNQKNMNGENTCISKHSTSITPSFLTDAVTALANSLNKAGLGDQLQQVANVLVQLIIKEMDANARKVVKHRMCSRKKGSKDSPPSRVQKRGKSRKNQSSKNH